MIFVHPDAHDAVDFGQWISQFEQHFGPYDLSGFEEVLSVRRPMKANWKLFVENHIESYHLWYAHRRSILSLDHKKQNGHGSFFEPTLVHRKIAEFEKRFRRK